MESKHDEKKLAMVASLMEDAIHSIAHKEVHRQVSELRESVVFNAERLEKMDTEVIKTQVQLTKRVSELEADMGSAEGNMKNLMQMTDKALDSIRADLHSATVEMNNPDDERIAELETKFDSELSDINERLLRVEELLTTIVGYAEKIGRLD